MSQIYKSKLPVGPNDKNYGTGANQYGHRLIACISVRAFPDFKINSHPLNILLAEKHIAAGSFANFDAISKYWA